MKSVTTRQVIELVSLESVRVVLDANFVYYSAANINLLFSLLQVEESTCIKKQVCSKK